MAIAGAAVVVGIWAVQYEGFVRGFVVGAGLSAVVGVLAAFVFLISGAAAAMSGAMAEAGTSDDLRALQKRGWVLVNGMKVDPRTDIDHLAVGRGGVLVIETKWSHEPWPPHPEANDFLGGRLRSAISQADRALTLAIAALGDRAKGGVARAVLVLSAPPGGEAWPPYQRGRVTVLRSRDLPSWLDRLGQDALTDNDVHALADRAGTWIAAHEARHPVDQRYTPTVDQLLTRWLVVAPLVAVFSLAGLVALGIAWRWWGYAAGSAATVVAAVMLRRSDRWRPAVYAACTALAVLTVVTVVSVLA